MKKLLLLTLITFSVLLGYSFAASSFSKPKNETENIDVKKTTILKVGLVADSHNENDLLLRALNLAKERVDFVMGLGDYTNLGTLEELMEAKKTFDSVGIEHFLLPGDRDGWDSRNKEGVNIFRNVFGDEPKVLERKGVTFVLLDNSDIYKGIDAGNWFSFKQSIEKDSKLTLVFAHKTPFHPDSSHVMGEDSVEVASQAAELNAVLAEGKIDGFFTGDIHFFARFKDRSGSVRISTIGAVASERNLQGPRFGILNIFDDFTWEIEDIEIR